jgi:hypothetical protein
VGLQAEDLNVLLKSASRPEYEHLLVPPALEVAQSRKQLVLATGETALSQNVQDTHAKSAITLSGDVSQGQAPIRTRLACVLV